MRLLTCEPNVEIRGDVLLSLLQNIQAKDIQQYVKRYDLADVQAGYWYRMQSLLDLLNDLAANENQTPNFVAIGMAIAETAYMSEEMSQLPFEEILLHWDDHYQSNHRHGDIGHKAAEKIANKHYQITLYGSLYPDDLEYGVLYGFGRRFLPTGTFFTVRYDDNVQRMDDGGQETVLLVKWE